jgi:hypothetical protein
LDIADDTNLLLLLFIAAVSISIAAAAYQCMYRRSIESSYCSSVVHS